MLCHLTLAFILSAVLQGAAQVLLLRTQINGTCCNAGSRRLLPFSPLLTPTHPLNSSSILTHCSNDQVACWGRWENGRTGPSPHKGSVCHSVLRLLCGSHRALTARGGGFSPRGPHRPAPPRKALPPASAQVRGAVRPKPAEGSPGARARAASGLCSRAGRAAAAFPGSPCSTVPIFLVSINSGKIFKYTKA